MTFGRFIDVGFTILVQEYQRLGVDLLSAIEKVGALGSDASAEEVAPTAADNAKSMEALMGMMSGVKGAPV